MSDEQEEGLKFPLSDDKGGPETQELNLEARLIAGALQDSIAFLELAFARLLTDFIFFSNSFFSVADFSKVTLRLELSLIKRVSKL